MIFQFTFFLASINFETSQFDFISSHVNLLCEVYCHANFFFLIKVPSKKKSHTERFFVSSMEFFRERFSTDIHTL